MHKLAACRERCALFRILAALFMVQLFMFAIDTDCLAVSLENGQFRQDAHLREGGSFEAAKLANSESDCAKPALRRDRYEVGMHFPAVSCRALIAVTQNTSSCPYRNLKGTITISTDILRSVVLLI